MRHPFRVVVGFLAVSLLGLAIVPQLSVNLNPDYALPALTLSFALPGSSPEIVEQEATSVLENAFSGLANLNEIKSVSSYNKGSVTLLFDRGIAMDFKRFEVISILRNIRQQLPARMTYPTISQNLQDEQEAPLLVYRINAPFATTYIKSQLDRHLLRAVTTVSGVDRADVTGAVPLQVVIDLDPQKAQAYNINHTHIITKLKQEFTAQSLGYTTTSRGYRVLVKAGNQHPTLAALRALVINYAGQAPVRLQDVARVYLDEQSRYRYFRVNGLNSVSLRIFARKQQNRLQLAAQVKAAIATASRQLPASFEVIKDYDDTTFLAKELKKIYYRAGLSVLILTLFIFFMYRHLQHLAVLLLGIVVTLCLTLLTAWLWQVNIHLYTIAGITIAFGLVVDNAIVMLDHLSLHKNRKIFLALLAATGTTMAALSVIYFLPAEERQNLSEFSAIIIIALVMSLLVALWFTPALYALLLQTKARPAKPRLPGRYKVRLFTRYCRLINYLQKYRRGVALALVLAFGTPIFLLPARWEGQAWYNATIGSDLYQEDIRPVTDKWLGGTLRLFVRNVFEKSGYRTNEQTRLYVHAHLPFGHTLEQMNTAIRKVEQYLSGIAGLEKFVTSVYSGQDASVTITFKEAYENGALPYQLKARLIARSLDWGGVEWSVYGVGRGFSNSSGSSLPSYRVVMKGYNYDELARQAEILAGKLLKHKRIQKVNTNERLTWGEQSSTQVVLAFDLDNISRVADINTVATALRQNTWQTTPATAVTLNNRLVPVLIKNQDADRFSTHNLSSGTLWLNDTTQLAYASFVNLHKEQTMNAIHKENRQYIRVVGFDYYGSNKFGNKYLDTVLKEMAKELPVGYEAKKSGWQWNWEKTKRNYGLLLILAVGIYFICSVLFENLRQPLYIIGMVPLSFIGLFLTFAVFDFYFDQGGYAAFILLGGLTVNAAIFIVYDLTNLPGRNHNRNVMKAVSGKAKPILLTVASTCFGLTPFLLEGQHEVFWFSLAAGTIGGLALSLPAVFLVLPLWLMRKQAINLHSSRNSLKRVNLK